MTSLWQDIRYALRVLDRSRGFSAVAIVCLALGVGANTAIFSVVNTVLLRPLPFFDAGRLAMVREVSPDGASNLSVSPEHYVEWKDRAQSVESIAAYAAWNPNLTGVDEPERLAGLRATADLFRVLGVPPVSGRAWTREDEEKRERLVVVSYSFWLRRFGGDPGILGRSLRLDGESYRVAGIMPPNFRFPQRDVEVWAPMAVDATRYRGEHNLQVVLRRQADSSWDQARAECTVLMQRMLERERASARTWIAELTPLRDWYASGSQRTLWLLLGTVGLVLLMACANVANLLLAHGAAREQEMTIRSSLGATRGRLIAQLLTESVCLGVLGGGLGLVLSEWGRDGLLALLPGGLAFHFGSVAVDWRVLIFTLTLSLASALICGVVPALQMSHPNLTPHAATARASASRLRGWLLVSETALALILLAGAGLLIRSFALLYQVDPGFAVDNVLTARINLPASRYNDQQMAAFFEQAQDRLAGQPGVRASAAVTNLPLSGSNNGGYITFEGRPAPPPGADTPSANRMIVTHGYFETLQIRFREGRTFTRQDRAGALPVVIVNEAMAKLYWPGESPVGRRIKRGTPNAKFPWMTVVGVIADVKHGGMMTETGPTVFLPYPQMPERGMTLVVRGDTHPEALAGPVRAVIRAIDPDQPVAAIRTFRDVYWGSLAPRGMALVWMGIFAALALILAATGIYGVVAASVARRTREFGIRMALGAGRPDLLRMALRQAMMPVLTGVALGLAGAAALTSLLEGLIYGITAQDLPTFACAAVLLMLIALAASYIPARRAVALDPVAALRRE